MTNACDCGAVALAEGPDGAVDVTPGLGGGEGTGGSAVGGGTGGATSVDPADADGFDAGDVDGGAGSDGGAPSDGGCPAFSCGSRCGPLRDFCRGLVVECGGCAAGQVCNLATNACGAPQITCAALNADCGQIRNSCGKRLNCGACPNPAQECDRLSNKCVDCSNPSPADLGYQCGPVWLGCGPYTTLTDAGTCGPGLVCNDALHVCEPQCTPPADAVTCATLGAQCGLVRNGCGGMADCGACATGLSCGARGVPNRCDAPEFPNECVAANRNCGPYTSACGGPTLDCGTCTLPDVCGANGRCGPPCTVESCTSPGWSGVCGLGLDAGCGATIDCGCTGPLLCSAASAGTRGTCGPPAACSQFGATGAAGAPCSNGPSPTFPQGNGTNLACPCTGAGLCIDVDGGVASGAAPGTCCVNTAACPANACGTSVTNTCTGAAIACGCTAPGTFCDTALKTCVQNHTCASYGATGGADAGCSVGPSAAFPKDGTTNLACPCNVGGACNQPGTTTPVTAGSLGACCFNTQVCAANECNTTKTNACTGATITCGCTAAGTHCNNLSNRCEANNGCTAFTTGDAGSTCSSGPSAAFPVGNGTFLTCPCTAAGASCFSDAGVVVDAGSPVAGQCCIPDRCPAKSCGTSIVDHCSGQTIACNTCSGAEHCNTTSHLCEANLGCGDYSATGAAGAVCSNGPSFSNGATPATLLTCPCTGAGVCTNGTTVVSGSTQGTCCVNTQVCGNQCNVSVTNSCTGVVTACQCTGTNYCNASNLCVPYLTCGGQTPPANGTVNAPCSTSANPGFSRYPGDATGLTCNCTGGRACSVDAGVPTPPHLAAAGEVGACCTNTAVCGTRCNQVIKNTCTNADITCACTGSNFCSAGNTCQAYAVCSAFTTGAVGANCSNGNDPTDFARYPGDPTGLTCKCAGTAGCYDGAGVIVTGPAQGTCCQADVCPAGFCGTMPEHCSGKTISCAGNCAAGNYCSGTACKPYETCSSLGAGGAGQPCSNGASASFPKGDGSNLTCACIGAGAVCVKPVPGPVVTGATAGTCCTNTAVCPANTCGTVTNTCTGATIQCGCSAGYHCNGSGVCNVDRTCASYTATGAVGATCSSVASSAFHDGPNNSNLTCPCSTAAPNPNNACVGSSSTTAGTCTCTPTAPANCGDNGKPNGCGGTMVSTCTAGTQACFVNACCTLPVCASGAKGEPCGAIVQCGTTTNCGACSTAGGNAKNACVANVCTCTPYTLGDCGSSLPAGQTSSNGCGGTVTCPG